METRLARRFPQNIKINLEINKNSAAAVPALKDKTLKVNLCDISVTGIGIIADCYLPKGIILDITLKGSDFGYQNDIFLNGEVRYSISVLFFDCKESKDKKTQVPKCIKCSGYRCGVKFLNTDPKQKKLIGDFIASAERRKKDRLKLAE